MDFVETLLAVTEDETRYPSVTWLFDYFDQYPVPPLGWREFYGEVRRLIIENLPVPESSTLDCVLEVNEFVMPAPGRRFPAELELAHDYVAYYTSATASLYDGGHAGSPAGRRDEYPAGRLTVWGDPLGLCDQGLRFQGDSRNEVMEGDFHVGGMACNELDSPLVRLLPGLSQFAEVRARKLASALGGTVGP
jgi:hypothetical protein